MSQDEFSYILKSYYGEDLGYNSDDVEYEYYSMLKGKGSENVLTEYIPSKLSWTN